MSLPPLNIAILGGGNIGSALAFHLSKANHQITAIARPHSSRLEHLNLTKAIITTSGALAPITPTSHLDPSIPYDLLIMTLPAHHLTPQLLSTIHKSAVQNILCLFNTFSPETLPLALPTKPLAFGMPFFQAHLSPSGTLHSRVSGITTRPTLLSDTRWFTLFQSAALPATFEANMPLWLASHAPLCVALEAISILGQRRGTGASWREAMIRAEGVRACFRLIRARGGEVYPGLKRGVEGCPVGVVAGFLWFFSRVRAVRELLVGAGEECEALVGVMVGECEGLEGVDWRAIERMRPGVLGSRVSEGEGWDGEAR